MNHPNGWYQASTLYQKLKTDNNSVDAVKIEPMNVATDENTVIEG